MDQSVIDRYKQLKWDKLLRIDNGENGSLEAAKPNLDSIKSLFDGILYYSKELSTIPNFESQVQSAIDQFLHFCETNILGDSYTDSTQRDEKIQAIKQQSEYIISNLIPIIGYMNFISNKNKLDQKLLLQMIEKQNILNSRIEEGEIRYNNLVKDEEISPFGKEFSDLAKENNNKAKINLIFMFSSMFITVTFAFIFLQGKTISPISSGSDLFISIWNYIINLNIFLEIFIISIGGYIVAHFSRNYSAEMNMYYQNKHRQISLNSHKRIIESVESTTDRDSEKDVRNAILLQITKTMYEIKDSGYLKKQNNPMPTTQIIENVRLK